MNWFGTALAIGAKVAAEIGRRQPQQQQHSHTSLVESLCQQLGWRPDEFNDESTVTLHFKDGVGGIRKLAVTSGAKVMVLATASCAVIDGNRVRPELLGYLLVRNAEILSGAWQMQDAGHGRVSFVLKYCGLCGGMGAEEFKYFCEAMVTEAHSLDVKLRSAGLI